MSNSIGIGSEQSITLEYELKPEGDLYGALTSVTATVSREGKRIGTISGIRVDRQKIPTNAFWETFDEHSADLEWIGSTLLENRYGRTNLVSLREADDDPEFDFMYIDSFHVDADQPGDVATHALRKFIHGKHGKGTVAYGLWSVSSFAYVLSGQREVHGVGKRRGAEMARRTKSSLS
ncbi:hypothetical protein ACHAWF_005206 [Thalassiosira exigua]